MPPTGVVTRSRVVSVLGLLVYASHEVIREVKEPETMEELSARDGWRNSRKTGGSSRTALDAAVSEEECLERKRVVPHVESGTTAPTTLLERADPRVVDIEVEQDASLTDGAPSETHRDWFALVSQDSRLRVRWLRA